MMNKLIVIDQLNNETEFDLFFPTNGMQIINIEGVASSTGIVNMTQNSIVDGSSYNGARANGKNIVITMKFVDVPNIEITRHQCQKIFKVKEKLKLIFEMKERRLFINGYVESRETSLFDQFEGAQVSILCEDAYFSDEESTDAVFNDSEALFEPPFENYVANGVNFVKRPYYHAESYVTNVNFVKYPFSTASGTRVAGLQYTWSNSVATPTINVSGTYDGTSSNYTIYDYTKRNGIMQELGVGKASITMPCTFVLNYGDASDVKGGLVFADAGTHYFEITKEMLMYNLGLIILVDAPQGESYTATIQPKIYKYAKYINGIFFNVNSDGSITANGTATTEVNFIIKQTPLTDSLIGKGIYILSGCPSGGAASTYRIQAAMNNWSFSAADYGNGAIINITDETTQKIQLLRINIHAGVTVNNLTFRPMISKNDSLIRDNAVKMPYVSPNHHVMNNGVFDVNPDGSVKVSTPNGETTNNAYFYMLHGSSSNDLFKRLGVGTFRLSGAPDSDAPDNGTPHIDPTSLVLAYGDSSAPIKNLAVDNGSGATFNIYENYIKQPYYNASGYTTNGITFTINADGSVTANGTATANARFFYRQTADNWNKLEKGKRYIISIAEPTSNSNIKGLEVALFKGNTYVNKVWYVSTTKEKIITIPSDVDFDRATAYISIGSGQTVNNLTFKPMIEEGSVAHEYMPDLTYYNGYLYYMLRSQFRLLEPFTCYPQIVQGDSNTPYMYTTTKYDESLQAYVPKLPDTRTIEISNYAKEHYKVINYDGDVAAGFIVEITITGNNVKDLTIANSTTHTMMRIDDDELPTEIIVGEGLKKGDLIRIDTRTRHKSIILIRDAVEYNILSALTTNSTWLKLENGENMIRFVASQGKNDVKMKLIYNNLYEGV